MGQPSVAARNKNFGGRRMMIKKQKQKSKDKGGGIYRTILKSLFFSHYDSTTRATTPFQREEMVVVAETLQVDLPKNKGDAIYNLRYRAEA